MADLVRDFLADDSGDLAVVDGDFATVGGKDAIPQGIDCRVKSFFSEIYLDGTQGVRWIQDILVKNPDPAVVQEEIRLAIADTPDVTDVVSSSFELNAARHATTNYKVATVYSTETLDGNVKGPV